MNYKFAQLLQTPGKQSNTVSDVYIAQVDSHKEELAGNLFVLTQINKKGPTCSKVIDFITDSLVQNFYQNEKILLREKMPSLKVEHIFEASLAKTNKQLTDVIKNNDLTLPFADINITAGVVFNDELYIANSGKKNVFLRFPKKVSNQDKNENFDINNILKNDKTKAEQKNYRLFSNVINGKIPKNASILITNEALPEYISQKQLIEITSSLPPLGAMEQIKNTINDINTYVSFAGILIKNTLFEKKSEIPKINTNNNYDSITSLNQTEDTTESLLTPSGMISFRKWFKLLSLNKLKNLKKSKTPLLLKDKIFVKRTSVINKSLLQTLKFFTNIYSLILRVNTNLFSDFLKKISNKNNIIKIFKGKLRLLVLNKKILLSISMLFLLALLININITKKTNKSEETIQEYSNITKTIEQKQNEAEASLLYRNNEGAKKLFEEISLLLNELPQETEKQQSQYQGFKDKFNLQLEKIRHVIKMDSAQELTDFKNVNSRSETENISYIPSTNKLYAADSKLKSVYILDLFDNISTTITDLDNPIERLSRPIVFNNDKTTSILYFNNNDIISVDTNENSFLSIDIDSSYLESLGGADIYNSKIYLINTNDNEIYRFNTNTTKLRAPSKWLIDNIDLIQAIDISIDGHIYILNRDGTIIKLLSGEMVNFSLGLCEPPIEEADKLQVSRELDFIYILEKKNNRLLVFNKAGQFLMQYQSDRLQDLKDFQIDEERKIIYFLNGSKIYKFNAEHFSD